MKHYTHEQIAQAIRDGELDTHLEELQSEVHWRKQHIVMEQQATAFTKRLCKWHEDKNHLHKRAFTNERTS